MGPIAKSIILNRSLLTLLQTCRSCAHAVWGFVTAPLQCRGRPTHTVYTALRATSTFRPLTRQCRSYFTGKGRMGHTHPGTMPARTAQTPYRAEVG